MSVDNAASAKTCGWLLASVESFVDERNELRDDLLRRFFHQPMA
jgi:hypothetical protein